MQRITLPRRLTQTLFFLLTGQWLLVGFLRCPFGVPFVSCAVCPMAGDCTGTLLHVPFVGLLLISVILLGRVFCGWACPLGYLEDVLGRIPKLRLERYAWFGTIEPRLRACRYLVLAIVIWLAVGLNFPVSRAFPYVVRSPNLWNWESVGVAWRMGALRYPVRAAILAFALVSGLLVTRLWCRYLCPLGALLGIFNKVSIWRPVTNRSACKNCGKYPRDCVQFTVPGTTSCVVCGECLQGCPGKAIRLRLRGQTPDATARRRPSDKTTDKTGPPPLPAGKKPRVQRAEERYGPGNTPL